MKCPKCGSQLTSEFDSARPGLWRCRLCCYYWSDKQQSEIESLRQALIDERNTVSSLSRKCAQLESDREYNAKLCEEKDAELSALKEENSRLRSGLKKLEWCGSLYYGETRYPICPVCDRQEGIGHASDCWLSALLKGDSNV